LVHRGHRSAQSLEHRKAVFFCFRNSTFDRQMQERIFEGDEEDVRLYVELTIENSQVDIIPCCPKGLVLADNRARGAFDVHPEFEGKERFVDDQ
jgi:hypothetical protein